MLSINCMNFILSSWHLKLVLPIAVLCFIWSYYRQSQGKDHKVIWSLSTWERKIMKIFNDLSGIWLGWSRIQEKDTKIRYMEWTSWLELQDDTVVRTNQPETHNTVSCKIQSTPSPQPVPPQTILQQINIPKTLAMPPYWTKLLICHWLTKNYGIPELLCLAIALSHPVFS